MNRLFLVLFLIFPLFLQAQIPTVRDYIRGGLPLERISYDVLHYDIDVLVDVDKKTLVSSNIITFKVVYSTDNIQIDLFQNMKIDSIVSENYGCLKYNRFEDGVFIIFPEQLKKDSLYTLKVSYHGSPKVAKNAPWDGGFVWKKDKNGKPFVGVAVQGTGASLWLACKDSQSDEPDNGITITITVPNEFVAVSNGRLISKSYYNDKNTSWRWQVKNPINSYNITINIADYLHFSDKLNDLDLDFYVLRDNLEKAKTHFKDDVKPMLACFQEKFGEYPFIEDGFKLVESPYLGMEHQSAIAYGNQYKKGYLGRDMTRSGVGEMFDFIIIHETGHEWFGNSITSKDIADMWIHEAFTTYSEMVYAECRFGYEQALNYISGQKQLVENKAPIVGQFGVNIKPQSSDMYYKGALFLNTLRHVFNNDELWWKTLKDFAIIHKKKIIEAKDVIDFFTERSQLDLKPIFNQYLFYSELPKLVIKNLNDGFLYYWKSDSEDFNMPVQISINDELHWITPSSIPKKIHTNLSNNKIEIDTKKFYISF